MNTYIYYFSGTGNSLYVAKELQHRIHDSILIPIAGLLNKGLTKRKTKLKSNAEVVGFIFPCHGLTIPVPILKFLKIIDLTSSKYIFAIVTRGGSIFHGFSKIEKLLRKQGKTLDSSFVINMWMNDPKLEAFQVPTHKDLKKIESKVQEKLKFIQKIIANQDIYEDDINGITFTRFKSINYILERLIPFTVHHIAPKVKKYFYSDPKCTGCGNCEKVCLSNKINIVNDRPVWQDHVKCYFCYTCLNYCPNHSIQIYSKFYMKSYTKERGRYPHPYAQVSDIVLQKTDLPTSLNYSRDYLTTQKNV